MEIWTTALIRIPDRSPSRERQSLLYDSPHPGLCSNVKPKNRSSSQPMRYSNVKPSAYQNRSSCQPMPFSNIVGWTNRPGKPKDAKINTASIIGIIWRITQRMVAYIVPTVSFQKIPLANPSNMSTSAPSCRRTKARCCGGRAPTLLYLLLSQSILD